jgi:hypothetical protein
MEIKQSIHIVYTSLHTQEEFYISLKYILYIPKTINTINLPSTPALFALGSLESLAVGCVLQSPSTCTRKQWRMQDENQGGLKQ